MGKGTEGEHYRECRLVFQDLPNIHEVAAARASCCIFGPLLFFCYLLTPASRCKHRGA